MIEFLLTLILLPFAIIGLFFAGMLLSNIFKVFNKKGDGSD